MDGSKYINSGMLNPIEIAPNSNLVDFTPKSQSSRIKIDMNSTNKSNKFKKLNPKIYKVK
jgi:hypothetical protein